MNLVRIIKTHLLLGKPLSKNVQIIKNYVDNYFENLKRDIHINGSIYMYDKRRLCFEYGLNTIYIKDYNFYKYLKNNDFNKKDISDLVKYKLNIDDSECYFEAKQNDDDIFYQLKPFVYKTLDINMFYKYIPNIENILNICGKFYEDYEYENKTLSVNDRLVLTFRTPIEYYDFTGEKIEENSSGRYYNNSNVLLDEEEYDSSYSVILFYYERSGEVVIEIDTNTGECFSYLDEEGLKELEKLYNELIKKN